MNDDFEPQIVRIEAKDRARALAALYNATEPQANGMGWLHYDPVDMTEDEAAKVLEHTLYVDYLKGRPIKVKFNREDVDLRLYDRDAGRGRGRAALMLAGVIPIEP